MRPSARSLRPGGMDKHYYFIVEPTGDEDGPYILAEIAKKLAEGSVSPEASLLKVGETRGTPIREVVSALAALPPPPPPARKPHGTQPYTPIPVAVPVMAEASAPVALQPYVPPMPQLAPPPRPHRRWPYAAGVAALALGGIAVLGLRGGKEAHVESAMVRVSTPTGTGAGFMIDGPDSDVYVATANHVVDRGERVLVERDVEITDKRHYVEAYPETEIVAADPDADLAIIRIKNVDASRFHRLKLAKEPQKDARISSYGYPGSSLVKHAGLMSKDGKVLSLVMFPAYDERYARIVRENAVDGLLISTDIEPGFSGGPTTNEAGEVVGVNVTKDHAHIGQNGAISVVALRALLDKVKPASAHTDPKPEDIVALLNRVQTEYLLLPVEERGRVRESEFLSAGDLPTLRSFVGEIRREERNADTAFLPKQHLSGQAALGMYFARLPGKLLETYRAPSVAEPLAACDASNRRLAGFLGELDHDQQHALASVTACDELAMRPLAWDLAAATLQWDGHEKQYTVTKLDRMDDEGNTFRASVRITGAASLIELWIGMDRGTPRLKLFDPTGNLYAIASPRNVSTSALQGTWVMKRPRVTDAIDKDAEVEGEETLAISIGDEHKVSIRHVLTQKFFQVGKKSSAFACSRKATIETGVVQSFSGLLENGVVTALPEKELEPTGADAGSCVSNHRADRIVAVKLTGDQLTLYRTDGVGFPETVQFTKQ
ncbi:MAG: serine protease [Deltaproteobacteria bacterium]